MRLIELVSVYYLMCSSDVKNNLCLLERPVKENKNQAFFFFFLM